MKHLLWADTSQQVEDAGIVDLLTVTQGMLRNYQRENQLLCDVARSATPARHGPCFNRAAACRRDCGLPNAGPGFNKI